MQKGLGQYRKCHEQSNIWVSKGLACFIFRFLRRPLIESSKGVADRLTEAMHRAYAPATEKAKRTDLEARRAAELAQTAQTLAHEKKRLEEALQAQQQRFAPLLELEKRDPQAAKSVLRQVQERLDLDKIRREFARRAAELPKMARTAAGAVLTLAKRGMAALDGAGGKIDAVDWDKVETLAIAESVREHRQKPEEVYSAMMKHSPASADAETNPQRGERVRALVEHFAGKSVSMDRVKQQEQGRDYSR